MADERNCFYRAPIYLLVHDPMSKPGVYIIATRQGFSHLGFPRSGMRRYLAGWFLLLAACTLSSCSQAQTTGTVTVTSTGFTMKVQSATEMVTYQWVAPVNGSLYTIGSMIITDSIAGASPLGRIQFDSHLDWIGPSEALQSIAYQTSGSPTATLLFVGPNGATHLTLAPMFDGRFAAMHLSADQPTIQGVSLGQLSSSVVTQRLSVPYYTQAVNYVGSLALFENSYFDPFHSNASTITTNAGQKAFYALNEKGTTSNRLDDLWKVSVSNDITNVLPYPEHPASPYISALAGKVVLDIKSGTFDTIAAQIANLGNYGVNRCVVLIEDWQLNGYDNGLPAQYPANTALGGEAGMHAIGSAAHANGCLFGLHENYVDYYPDYVGYMPSATMRNSDGTQLLAWLNTTTGIQSFATKPGLFVPEAQTQSPSIHSDYGTNMTFIDVNSSAPPWWRTDEDPSASGSGMFATYRDASIGLWAYERSLEKGPVLGEGKYHWFWSGLLDGVEAQFGAESTPITNGLTAPLFVDFDLTRIHPLQANYGMGFYDRWMPEGTTITSTLALDAYRMQEVIFGHGPYLNDAFWSSVPRALLEQNLVSPLATRYAVQTPGAIVYAVNGVWSDATAAAKAGDFSLAKVFYPNGDTVIANSRSSTLAWGGLQIPQYGWAATGSGLSAYTALVGGQIADYSQTHQSIYANARNQADILSENTVATPSVAAFQQVATGVLQIQLAWDVNTPQPTTAYQEFIHFVSSQAGATSNSLSGVTGGVPLVATESWTVGEHVVDKVWNFHLPSTMPDGTYQIRVGLFSGNQRAALYGNNDGNQRYVVGSITVSKQGASIVFTAVPIRIATPDPRLNSAGAVVNFGAIQTDGMVMIQQQADGLQVSAYPRSRNVVVDINSRNVAMPASVVCDNGDVVVPAMIAPYWQLNLRGRKYCTWAGTLP